MPEAKLLTLDEARQAGGLMRRLVLGELGKLRHGRLRMTLPCGGVLTLGNATSGGGSILIKDEDFFRRIVRKLWVTRLLVPYAYALVALGDIVNERGAVVHPATRS
jgi:hypothetical protein